MAITSCELTVEKPQYSGGDSLRGRFKLVLDDELRCRTVKLHIGWRTSGRGDQDMAYVFTHTVHEGRLPLGVIEDDFEAVLPAGPVSHLGYYVSVGWFAKLHVDVPFGADVTHECEFQLAAKVEQPNR